MEVKLSDDRKKLFDELKQLTNTLEYSFYMRNLKMPISQIKQLIKFAKKGHSLELLNKTMTIPKSYIRLLDKLDDITVYPCLRGYPVVDFQMIEELETVVSLGLDTYMYQYYTSDVGDLLRKRLYKLLTSNINVTRDLDYANVEPEFASNYTMAIWNGYSKEMAGNLLFVVNENCQKEVIHAHNNGIDIRTLFDVDTIVKYKGIKINQVRDSKAYSEYHKAIQHNRQLCKNIHLLVNEGLDIKKHSHFLTTETKYPLKQYVFFIKYTKGEFYPDLNSDNSPYLQYLEHIGAIPKGSEIALNEALYMTGNSGYVSLIFYDELSKRAFNTLILKEIQFRFGIDTTQYEIIAEHMTTEAFQCILLGEDISTYLALHLKNELTPILLQLINGRSTPTLTSQIVAFRFLREI